MDSSKKNMLSIADQMTYMNSSLNTKNDSFENARFNSYDEQINSLVKTLKTIEDEISNNNNSLSGTGSGENDYLREHIMLFEEKIDSLKDQLQNLAQENAKILPVIETKITELTDNLNADDASDDDEKILSFDESFQKNINDKITEFAIKLEAQEELASSFTMAIDSIEGNIESNVEKISAATEKNTSLSENLENLLEENTTLKEQLALIDEKVLALEETTQQTSDDTLDSIPLHEEQILTLNTKVANQEELFSAFATTLEHLTENLGNIQLAAEETESLKEQIELVSDKIFVLEGQVQENSSNEIFGLTTDPDGKLEILADTVASQKEILSAFAETFENLGEHLEKMQTASDESSIVLSNINALTEENESLQAQIELVNDKIYTLEEQLQENLDKKVSSPVTDYDENNTLLPNLDAFTEENEPIALQVQIELVNDKIRELEELLQDNSNKEISTSTSDYDEQIETLTNKITSQEELISAFATTLEHLTENLEKIQIFAEEQPNVSAKENDSTEDFEQINSYDEKFIEFTDKISAQEEIIDSFATTLENLEANVEKIQNFADEKNTLSSDVDMFGEENNSLKEKIVLLEEKMLALESLLEKNSSPVQQEGIVSENNNEQIAELADKVSQQEDIIKSLTESLDSMKDKIENTQVSASEDNSVPANEKAPTEENSTFNERIAVFEEKIEVLETQQLELKEAKANAEIPPAFTEKIITLTEKIFQQDDLITAFMDSTACIDKNVSATNKQIALFEEKISSLENQQQELKAAQANVELPPAFTEKIIALTEKLIQQDELIKVFIDSSANIDESVFEKLKSFSENTKEDNTLSITLNLLKEENAALNERTSLFEETLSGLTSKLLEIENITGGEVTTPAGLDDKLESLDFILNQQQELALNREQQILSLEEQLVLHDNQLEILKTHVSECATKVTNADANIKSITKQGLFLESTLQELQDQIEQHVSEQVTVLIQEEIAKLEKLY